MQCDYPPYAHGRKAIADSSKITFGELAREYLELNKPNWEEWHASNAENLIETHLVAGILAIRAKIAISKNSEGKEVTGCNFQSLRRTSGTLFGDPCGGSCCVAGIRDGFPRRKEEAGSGAGNRH